MRMIRRPKRRAKNRGIGRNRRGQRPPLLHQISSGVKKKQNLAASAFIYFFNLYEVERHKNRGLNILFIYTTKMIYLYISTFQENPCCSIKRHLFGFEITKML